MSDQFEASSLEEAIKIYEKEGFVIIRGMYSDTGILSSVANEASKYVEMISQKKEEPNESCDWYYNPLTGKLKRVDAVSYHLPDDNIPEDVKRVAEVGDYVYALKMNEKRFSISPVDHLFGLKEFDFSKVDKLANMLFSGKDIGAFAGLIPSTDSQGGIPHRDAFPLDMSKWIDRPDEYGAGEAKADMKEIKKKAYAICFIATQDLTPENGVTAFLPGSHKEDAELSDTADKWFQPHLKCGDILIFDGCTIHSAMGNPTGKERTVLYRMYKSLDDWPTVMIMPKPRQT